jgi:hypothetical protein
MCSVFIPILVSTTSCHGRLDAEHTTGMAKVNGESQIISKVCRVAIMFAGYVFFLLLRKLILPHCLVSSERLVRDRQW